MKVKKLVLLLGSSLFLVACGMQGPLYLPKKQISTQQKSIANKDKITGISKISAVSHKVNYVY